jgi:hypothetical protein
MSMSYRQVICPPPVSYASPIVSIVQVFDVVVAYVSVASKVLEQLDLAKGSLGQNLLAEHIGDLLDGNTFVRLVIHRSAARLSERPHHIAFVSQDFLTRQSHKRPDRAPW